MPAQIHHHNRKLKVKLQGSKTWIKHLSVVQEIGGKSNSQPNHKHLMQMRSPNQGMTPLEQRNQLRGHSTLIQFIGLMTLPNLSLHNTLGTSSSRQSAMKLCSHSQTQHNLYPSVLCYTVPQEITTSLCSSAGRKSPTAEFPMGKPGEVILSLRRSRNQ